MFFIYQFVVLSFQREETSQAGVGLSCELQNQDFKIKKPELCRACYKLESCMRDQLEDATGLAFSSYFTGLPR